MSLTAPDSQSALVPFFQSNGLLLQVLGGVNIISDFNGNQVQNTEYDPWGKQFTIHERQGTEITERAAEMIQKYGVQVIEKYPRLR